MTGILMAAGRSTAAAGGTVTASVAPTSQSANFVTTGTGMVTRSFSSESVTVSGGSPTSYNWYFTGTSGGAWSIGSGQGTASCVPRVTDAPDSAGAATLKCDIVVNGVTYTVSAALSYTLEYFATGGVDYR